jgi:dTDP-4-amino-4,6-dideoxygalactose transaminase
LEGRKLKAGTIGDASIYSFGMEKVLSSTRGGFGWIKDPNLNKSLQNESSQLQPPRIRDILRGILNPIVWKAKEKLGFLGEILYKIAVGLKIHELGLTKLELIGQKASWLPYSFPNANAILGINQFKKFSTFDNHRKMVSRKYFDMLGGNSGEIVGSKVDGYSLFDPIDTDTHAVTSYLRFPILVDDADTFRQNAEKQGIYLGNWYTEVIHCMDVDMGCMLYSPGKCPNAEWIVGKIVNLPTHVGINQEQIKRIVQLFQK